MTDIIWLDKDAYYRVIATDPVKAGNALREHLIARKEIGKWSTVRIEFVTATHTPGLNVYREVN